MTKRNYISVSQSKAKTWRTCHKQHDYKYNQRLRKKRVKRPFMFGRVVHEMIEAHANGDDPFEKLDAIDIHSGAMFRREREEYGDILEDIRVIMTEYFEHYPDDARDALIYSRRKGRSAEFPFEIELENGIVFKGKIDGVGRAKRMRWLVEHKTFKREPSEDDRWRSVQSAVYIRAIQLNGWWNDIEGTLWDYVSSKPPGVPSILKNGEISRRHLITLPTRLRAFIRAQGKDPKKYKDLIANAEHNRSSYFIRAYSPMRREVVDQTWEDFVETAREIAEHGQTRRGQIRNVGQHCKWCDFADLCKAEVLGLDGDFLRKKDYTIEPEDTLTDETDRSEE